MHIARHFTKAGESPFAGIPFASINIEICHSDPAKRLCVPGFEAPAHWSYEACEFLARHYLRKTGVPAASRPQPADTEKESVPEWLWPSVANEEALHYLPESERYGSEVSAQQVFHRLAGAWTYWGWKCDYFDTEEDARAFYDECCYLMAKQMIAPAAPQWLNTGLHWAYGIDGPAQGHYHIEPQTGRVCRSMSAYVRPQHHHCFIQSVRDELVSDGGIMDLWEREARLFKYGSGAGCNMSKIRGVQESISGGASSVGLMRFLSIGDKAASAIKPGGGVAEVEKLVLVDIDHPDIEAFVRWKAREEHKAAALMAGARQMRVHLTAVMKATLAAEDKSDAQNRKSLREAIAAARRAMIPESYIARVMDYVKQGLTEVTLPIYDAGKESELFLTIGAHQARMAVRVPDIFLQAVMQKDNWTLKARVTEEAIAQTQADTLMDQIAQAAWATGDPGIHFTDSIAAWHGCHKDGSIQASSPHGEFLFLDDTACDIAVLNLAHFVDDSGELRVAAFEHVSRLMTLMLDISITMAQYPSRDIARNTYRYRPIGLSVCNLSAMLMQMGYAFDSDEGRATAAAVMSLMTGTGYIASAELARELGAFEAFTENRDGMMHLLWRHHEAAFGRTQYLGSVHVAPVALDHAFLADAALSDAVQRVWDIAMIRGDEYGYSNAQISLVSTNPAIARLLDADPSPLSPPDSLVRMTAPAAGTMQRQILPPVVAGLKRLGYKDTQIADILCHLCGAGTLVQAPGIDQAALRMKGFGDEQLARIEDALAHASHLRHALDPFILGEAFCRDTLGLKDAQIYDATFDLLAWLGFSAEDIATANHFVCGSNSLINAPHLSEEDLAVFAVRESDPAQQNAQLAAQLKMMAAIQPFVSGGIAHQLQLSRDATIAQCRDWMLMAWRLGLKSLSMMRDGSGLHDEPMALEPIVSLQEESPAQEVVSAQSDGVISESWQRPWSVRRPSISVAMVNIKPEVAASAAQNTREKLPPRRAGYTQKAVIGGQTVYLRTGEYSDGRLGEIFVDMPKQNAAMRSMINQFAIAISVALQHGVPLDSFVDAFRMSQFDPAGHVEGSDNIETATSVLDYIFRELSLQYGKQKSSAAPAEQSASAGIIREILKMDA